MRREQPTPGRAVQRVAGADSRSSRWPPVTTRPAQLGTLLALLATSARTGVRKRAALPMSTSSLRPPIRPRARISPFGGRSPHDRTAAGSGFLDGFVIHAGRGSGRASGCALRCSRLGWDCRSSSTWAAARRARPHTSATRPGSGRCHWPACSPCGSTITSATSPARWHSSATAPGWTRQARRRTMRSCTGSAPTFRAPSTTSRSGRWMAATSARSTTRTSEATSRSRTTCTFAAAIATRALAIEGPLPITRSTASRLWSSRAPVLGADNRPSASSPCRRSCASCNGCSTSRARPRRERSCRSSTPKASCSPATSTPSTGSA